MSDELNLENLDTVPAEEPVVETPGVAADEAAAPVELVADLSTESDASADSADVESDAPAATESAPAAFTQIETVSLNEDEEEVNESEQTEETDTGQQAADEFSESLRSLGGEWCMLHTYSDYEKRVKTNVKSRVTSSGMEDQIFQVEVPMEEIKKHTEKGKKTITHVRVPGCMLIRIWPGENVHRIVRRTEGATGFVGPTKDPTPLSHKEVVAMMAPMITSEALEATGDKPVAAKERRVEVSCAADDQVAVTDGPFATIAAIVSDVEPTTQELTTLVSIFSHDTPVELGFHQVQKLD